MKYSKFYSLRAVAGIYSITCPLSGKVVYVGKSATIGERFRNHLSSAKSKHSSSRITQWFKEIENKGLTPIFQVIEEITDNYSIISSKRERHWIEYYYNLNPDLLNIDCTPNSQHYKPIDLTKRPAKRTRDYIKKQLYYQ